METGIINIIRQRLKDIELQRWLSEIDNDTRKDANQGNKMRTYRKERIPRSIIILHRVWFRVECLKNKNYNFLACDWFKKVLFSTNSLAKLLSDSLLLDSLLLDSLFSDSSISQSHSKMQFKSTNHIQSCNDVCSFNFSCKISVESQVCAP